MAGLLADLDGRLLGSQAKDVDENASADERLERLRTAVADLLRRAGVARGSLRAVGAATPGIVEAVSKFSTMRTTRPSGEGASVVTI